MKCAIFGFGPYDLRRFHDGGPRRPTSLGVKMMSEGGGPEPFKPRRTTRDPRTAVDRTHALHERLFGNALAALELYTISLGEQLGLYRALVESGQPPRRSWPNALEPPSGTCGSGWSTTPRVTCSWSTTRGRNHWLAGTGCRRTTSPYSQTPTMSVTRLPPASTSSAPVAGLPQLVEAFRVGNAPLPLSWEPEGRAEPNRATFLNLLGTEWLPAIMDVDDRLGPRAAGAGARPGVRHGLVEYRHGAGLPQHQVEVV